MAWQDREYYGGEPPRGYLSNPAGLLSLSVPFGTWLGARVRLHFWLLLTMVFGCVGLGWSGAAGWIVPFLAMYVFATMGHEFGHRTFARWVGGSHDEFVLWPAGGMIPANVPQHPWALFVGSAGGIAGNFVVALVCTAVIWAGDRTMIMPSLNPLQVFGTMPLLHPNLSLPSMVAYMLMTLNTGVLFASLLPYYWFDGAPILESVLWRWLGRQKAVIVVCWVGMILAAPMLMLSLAATSFLGMVFWGLLFASAYSKRQQTLANPYSGYDDALAMQLAARPARTKVKRASRITRWANERKTANREKLQKQVDEILEKVSREGMHSLSEGEKRALERASRELRDEG